MKKKKILFTIWTYSWGGGAENILTNLVNHLDPNKYEIDILEYFHSDIKKEPVNENINILPPIIDSTNTNKFEKLYKMILTRWFPKLIRKKYANKDYDIEIVKTYFQSTENTKSMFIRVTDKELLQKTGGIVQGMSGSPIIQNGKLIGAVTHVLINDPTRGYGIFIENMLEEAG